MIDEKGRREIDPNLYEELQLQYKRFMELADAAVVVNTSLHSAMQAATISQTDNAGDTWLERLRKQCATCQMRTFLTHNMALSYFVDRDPSDAGCLIVYIKGLSPHGATPYGCMRAFSLTELQTAYAAESVVKVAINSMFEKVVEQCEKEERRYEEAKSDSGSAVVRFPGKNMDR